MKKEHLATIRKEIEGIDEEIFRLLKKRFLLVKKVGEHKKKHGLPIRNSMREKQLIEAAVKKTRFDQKFVSKLYKIIFNHSYTIEK